MDGQSPEMVGTERAASPFDETGAASGEDRINAAIARKQYVAQQAERRRELGERVGQLPPLGGLEQKWPMEPQPEPVAQTEAVTDPETLANPELSVATERALKAKEAYRAAEAELMRALIAEGMVPLLPNESPRDHHRRVKQTAREWLTMNEQERDWNSGL